MSATAMEKRGGTKTQSADLSIPPSLRWTSTGPILAPVSDAAHELLAIKDPTLVFYRGRWHLYVSTVSSKGVYAMAYLNFADLRDPSPTTFYYMDRTPGFDTYVAAPQLFYFEPHGKWYLVFQSGPPMYSTNDDPGEPAGWSRPAPFFSSEPAIVAENGGWLDFWVIADRERCHMFFSNDRGRWYKSSTSIADFPKGFSEPVVVMEEQEAGRLYEACNVYTLGNSGRYLALIEAFDESSRGRRYFRSFTAESLEGPWSPFLHTAEEPFAGLGNVAFAGEEWTVDISHGELVRAGYDQSLTIDPDDLRFLYQGFDPSCDRENYNAIPWRLGLLSQAR